MFRGGSLHRPPRALAHLAASLSSRESTSWPSHGAINSRGTPLKEILQLMREEKWTFPADIEVEYKIPEGSCAVAEVAKCVRYC